MRWTTIPSCLGTTVALAISDCSSSGTASSAPDTTIVVGTTPPPSTATTAAPTTATPTFAGFSMKRFCDSVGPLPQFSKRPNPTSSVPVLAVLPSYDPRRSVTTVKQIFSGLANTIVELPEVVDPLSHLTDCFYATANAFLAAPSAPLDASYLTAPAISTLA